MPFNDATKRLEALFNFVDEFASGDPANRSDFDQVVLDLIGGVNDLATYFEGVVSSGDTLDKRYLGRYDIPPTTRIDGSPLQTGDFYSNYSLSRTNIFYVWTGLSFALSSDFDQVSDFFKTLAAAPDAATIRGLLGLGSAAIQNASAFAPAGSVSGIATALQLAANGLAKPLTNWDNAHTAGPGCGFFAGDAAALNAPVALNTVGVYLAYDANSGLLIAGTPSTGTVYHRARAAGVWAASWLSAPVFNSDTGIVAQINAGSFAKRSFVSADTSLTVTNPGGVAGNIDLSVNEAALLIPRGSIADTAINRTKLDTGLASQAYSWGVGGGSITINLNPYSFFPSNQTTSGSPAGGVAMGGGGAADSPAIAISSGGVTGGTLRWRYINA